MSSQRRLPVAGRPRPATFYEQLAGCRRVHDDDEWITLEAGDGWRIGRQRATDHLPPRWPDQDRPKQVHLDFWVPDIDSGGRTRPATTA